ncbi:hypothetical protein MMC19_006721 [Ptychographa xylographoides]|nr:hypothetical protein [Ptychographa xylographoides]
MASGSDVSDRYRQAQISSLRAPTSVPQASVAEQNQGNAGYGYTQGQQQYAPQLQGTAVQFQPDFPSDPQRVQQFPQYASSLVYNLPQQPQTPQQSPYDSVQQFQPRQSAAIEVLSNQFGVPQYYPIGDVASAPGPSSQSYAAAPFQQSMAYQPTQASRSTLSSSYAVGAADYAQSTMPTVLETQNAGSDDSGYDAAYNQYLDALRRTFQDVKDGRLIEAGQCLLEVSEWLLGHAGDLGLTKDEQQLHEERIKLWNDFNMCWLAVLQQQKDMTQRILDSGQTPQPPQSILRLDFLERMGRELVRLCDGMERHGLVDYQMGVWEEEIISVLIDCLDLLGGDGDDEDKQEPETAPSISTTKPR